MIRVDFETEDVFKWASTKMERKVENIIYVHIFKKIKNIVARKICYHSAQEFLTFDKYLKVIKIKNVTHFCSNDFCSTHIIFFT